MSQNYQTGPTSDAGKARSARNATKHGLTNFKPVVTEADRPEFAQMLLHLQHAIQPNTYLQQIAFERLVNACWNMQRALKLENQLREKLLDTDPMAAADHLPLADLYHRYYVRFEGSYRAALRELQRLQNLDLAQALHAGDYSHPVTELHDLRQVHRTAKRNPPQNPQPPSNQHSAKRNPTPAQNPQPQTARNAPCPCGSGQKYKRCCGVNAPPVLHAA